MTISVKAETIVMETIDLKSAIEKITTHKELQSVDKKVLQSLIKPYLYLKDDFPEQRNLDEIVYNVKIIQELSDGPILLKKIANDISQNKKLSKEIQVIGLRISRRVLKAMSDELGGIL